MRTAIIFLVSFTIGYYIFLLFSHPGKKKHKLPNIRIRNVELLPNFKIHGRHKTYHIHHWVVLSLALAVGAFLYEGIIRSPLFNGVTVGGILQGLRYKDRFKIRYPKQFSGRKQ
ncbi:MAG: hypothetical protein HYV40_06535 [Candidatus Levybacteria bacterium]|nr:hypothetical protein [Candidatus Levybacteria bacterium]